MDIIKLNGADAQAVAERIGGTLIMHNITDDEVMIAGGDLTKLDKECEVSE